ncbi:MAG: DUF4912 domain-containing protein [Spirochaetales bacterium]|nr:DUF4912 domain-containing protein [Spirochaetales bacterium]
MTKERLQSLSHESLLEIALREGIQSPHDLVKELLIDQILEAMEEDRTERQHLNNTAMRVKEKKYDIIRDEELEAQEKTNYPLPELYNETRVVLLLRDPEWAYAYWDLKEADIAIIQDEFSPHQLYLRVYELDEPAFRPDADYFDIPIKNNDSNWYINLPRQGMSYSLELIFQTETKEKILCRSNIITSPKEIFCSEDEATMNCGSEFFLLNGIPGSGGGSFRDTIPQRIISLIDAQIKRMKK